MDPRWVRKIRDRCIAQGVPFFFKQWGGTRKKLTGRELDGRTWDQMPKYTPKTLSEFWGDDSLGLFL
jgi:protein gp37